MTTTHLSAFSTATDMLRALQAREISSAELLQMHLDRIERYNPRLNAIVTPNYEEARRRAIQADEARANASASAHPRLQSLLGLPITIKDCVYVKGLTTTGGVPERVGLIDEEDAPIAHRVLSAGAVLMGKTNVPPYASDWQSNNPVFGRSNNPWNLERTPGGSTGGGGAAVAAGLTPVEFGGDFMGSIRIPAAFCGIYGHKPSLSAFRGTGHFPAGLLPNVSTTLAVVGPLARSSQDLEIIIEVTAYADAGEDVAWHLVFPPPRQDTLTDFRVAVLPIPTWLPTDSEILGALNSLVEKLRKLGVRVETTQPQGFDFRQYYKGFMTFAGAIEATGIDKVNRERRAASLRKTGDEFLAAYAMGTDGSAADFVNWHGEREKYRQGFREFFHDWDVLLAPANIVNAFPHTAGRFSERTLQVNGDTVIYGRQSAYPSLANLSGHPATAFPVGLTTDGLPIGLQAIGPYLEDRTPLRFAAHLAREFGGFVPPPGYD
jgi:amidase